jgi:hypothetical protein
MFAPLSTLVFGQLLPGDDNSVPNPFGLLLAAADSQKQYLVELYPYDPEKPKVSTWLPAPLGSVAFGALEVTTIGDIERVYLSDLHFITRPDDSVPDQYFSPVVNNPLQFDASLLNGNDFGIRTPSYGAIQIQNGDGAFDGLADLSWRGRRIVVKAGGRDFRYEQFVTIFDGVVVAPEFSDDIFTLTVRDHSLKLQKEIESPSYAGTGGLEGGDDLAGKMKPLLYGKAYNIEPFLVDPANLVYQVHAGSMQAVDAVYDRGVALGFHSDVSDITAVTPGSGEYATSLANGYIKLGSTPSGRITSDARGDNTGGYVSTASGIIMRLVQTKLGAESISSSEIDLGAFSRLATELPGSMGIFITEKTRMSDLLDQLLLPCLAYWRYTRTGLLSAGFIDTPGVDVLTVTDDEIEASGIMAPEPVIPAWRISVGYAPAGVVQKEDEIAAGATDAQRTFAGQPFRKVVDEDASVRSRYPQAVERVFETLLTEKADAEALLDRLVRIYGRESKIYRVPSYGLLYRADLGDTVKVQHSRYSLNKSLAVVGISEDADIGRTTLELWG